MLQYPLMSGHSKWSTIKRKKEALDQKRGQVFTKLARAITVAVKTGGGGDPDINFSLRMAIDKAKDANMPNDNIDRAIDRGLGKTADGGSLDEFLLEGYGPEGVAVVVEVVTDNRNRSVAEVKNIFEKNGGSLAEPGSVMYQFNRVGEVEFQGDLSEEGFLEIIDLGAEDLSQNDNGGVILCKPDSVGDVANKLKELGIENSEINVGYKSSNMISVDDNEKMERFFDKVREHDDVEEVFSNVET